MSQIGKKAINAQVQELVAKAKVTNVLVASVDLLDKSGSVDVPIQVLQQVGEKVHKQQPQVSFMLIAAGTESCEAMAFQGDNRKDLSATQWILSLDPSDSAFGCDENAHGTIECAKPDSPLKRKDLLISKAFEYLKTNNYMSEDDSSSEEMPDFDEILQQTGEEEE